MLGWEGGSSSEKEREIKKGGSTCHQKLSSWLSILKMSPFLKDSPTSCDGMSRSCRGR